MAFHLVWLTLIGTIKIIGIAASGSLLIVVVGYKALNFYCNIE